MMPSDADILAYAHGFYRRYGDFAARYARDYAERLKACGDRDGHTVWHQVADAIETGDALSHAA
jgi:hypothetical protein